MSKTLLGTISDRTEAFFGKDRLAEMRKSSDVYYAVWCEEWFKQADKFLEELKTEGLTETHSSIKTTVDSLRHLEPSNVAVQA